MSVLSSPLQIPLKEPLLSFCKATADTLRLDILRVLSQESFGVLELCHIFETPQSGMSHHLKILANAGLVTARREGNSIFYRRALIGADDPLSAVMESLFETVDQLPMSTDVLGRTQEVHSERSARSQEFFARNVDRLKQNQDLIADYSHYSGCLSDLLSNENLDSEASVLEVGPGACYLLDNLAEQFTQVVAIDNSRAMLEKARSTLSRKHAGRVEFIHTNIEALSRPARLFDLIVLNMVLHHIPSPAGFFSQAARLLNPEGLLLIADLCPHDQDWAREICGDLWLGFEPTDLDHWASEAGFSKGQNAFLGLKNGFQVQVRLFHLTTTHSPLLNKERTYD
ncbi:MAG: ArsR family transcriptional regulator [Pseudomonadales bacterium]|nr:ArsR family transcriptional regulator [Pseudomonadales bacterium]